MNFEDLSPELQNKAKACKTKEELLALTEAEGIELSEDQLEAVSGGLVLNCDSFYGFEPYSDKPL